MESSAQIQNDEIKIFKKSKHTKFKFLVAVSIVLALGTFYVITHSVDDVEFKQLSSIKTRLDLPENSLYNMMMSPLNHIKKIVLGDDPTLNSTLISGPGNSSSLQIARKQPTAPVLFPNRVGKKFIILYWTTIFGRNTWNYQLNQCPELKDKCEFTYNRSLQKNEADMLLLHMRDGYEKPSKPAHQKWMFYLQESPIHTFINLKNERHRFNLTMTYRLDSKYRCLYGHCQVDPAGKVTPKTVDYAKGKKHKVAWFVSNCHTVNKRIDYVHKLAQFTEVHQYGCGSKYSCPRSKGEWCDKVLLNNDYKFYLSFENSFCKDYVTEKLFRIIGKINVVPIVSGWYNYTANLPPHSFIDVRDFASPKLLAAHIDKVAANDTLYNEYFAWRHDTRWTCGISASTNGCELCRRGIADRQLRQTVDIFDYWSSSVTCQSYANYYRGI